MTLSGPEMASAAIEVQILRRRAAEMLRHQWAMGVTRDQARRLRAAAADLIARADELRATGFEELEDRLREAD